MRTVLPSEIRSQEKSRAKQSWRSTAAAAASGQENKSVPAWRSTPDKRTPVKQQQGWQSSSPYTKRETSRSTGPRLNLQRETSRSPGPSLNLQRETSRSPGPSLNSSPYTKHEPSRSPGPSLNSPGSIASPRTASKTLSAKSYDYIRKWQTIGSPDAHASDVYQSSHKETIGSPKTEVYRSQNQQESPAGLSMTYSLDDSIAPIKMTDTADSPSMNKLRNDLDTMSFLDYKSASNGEEKKQAVQADKKEEVAVEEEEDEESLYNIQHQHSVTENSVTSRSNASSSLVYSIEDTISSVANSRKSKESLRSVMERLKQQVGSATASQSSHDGTESGCSAGIIASELIASTLAECRMLLQMSPPPTPIAINSFAEPRKKVEEARKKAEEARKKAEEAEDEDSERAIKEAPSADDSAASDNSVAKLMRCPCCSHKFEEAGEHEPLHSFACEHIICKECVFQGTRYANSVPCPECGEKGAFDKSKPLVSRSYLRLIKKMGDSSSVKTKKNIERFKDSPMSVPSLINFGDHGKNANDEISVFSSVSGHMHTANLATRYRELAKQIDTDNVSILSTLSKQQPQTVKSSFTINPKQEDVVSTMSESQCIPTSKSHTTVNSDASSAQEAESVMYKLIICIQAWAQPRRCLLMSLPHQFQEPSIGSSKGNKGWQRVLKR